MQSLCVECPGEQEKQHADSPGVVEGSERVAVVLLVPDQWENADFTNAAFSRKRLKQGQLSICRVEHTTCCEVEHFVIEPQIAKKPERKLEGVAVAVCEDIRAIKTASGARAICVVDDPMIPANSNSLSTACECITPNYLGHAHLGFSQQMTGNDNVAVLANLRELFKKLKCPMPLKDAFHSCSS